MTVTFLGTGTSQGVPVIGCECEVCKSLDYRDKRLRSSVHIQIDNQSFVIDTGPDFRQQMLRENINRLDVERAKLYERIDARMDDMISKGLFDEAKNLYAYREKNALQTVGYQEIFGFMDGQYDQAEAIRLLKRNSRRYAKRQLTWFKRDEQIKWFKPDDTNSILEYIQNS